MFSSSPLIRHWRLGCVLAAVPAGLLIWSLSLESATPAAPPPQPVPVPVSTTTVQQVDLPRQLRSIGTVRSLHDVTLRPQVSGVVAEVLFREGQSVEKGQLLARIDDREVRAQLMQAQAQAASLKAQLGSAELDLQRYRNLIAEQAISQQVAEQQAARVAELRAGLQAAEAAAAYADVQLSYTRITSPVTGRAGLRMIDAGNLVQAGGTQGLVTVTQMNPISVLFTLPQEQLSTLQPLLEGGPAPVRIFDRQTETALATGQLSMIDNRVDPTTGTIQLRAELANDDGRLWPGQFVSVELQTGMIPQALVVPAQAVRQGLNGAFVYRVQDGKAELVAVQTRYQDDDIAVISDGLAVGEQVVLDGHSRLRPGMPVRPAQVTEPAAAAATASTGAGS